MQDVNHFTERIFEKVRAKAEKLTLEADEKRLEYIASEKERLEKEAQEKLSQFKKVANVKAKEQVRHKHARNQTDLALYRKKVLDSCFDIAGKRLAGESNDDFLSFFQKSVNKLDEAGNYTVMLGEKSVGVLNESTLSSIQTPDGVALVFSSETIADDGGFTLRSGVVEYVFLYDELLGQLKRKRGSKLLEKLFQ